MIYNRSLKDIYLKDNFNDTEEFFPFLLGRSVINYLVQNLKIDNIIIPYYICPMVINIFKSKNINIYYYEQFDDKLQILDNDIIRTLDNLELSGKTYFFWNDYLGIIGDIPYKVYNFLKVNNIEVIIDAIHTLPIRNYKADIVIYGFRKLLNEPFGALLKFNLMQDYKIKRIPTFNQYLYKLGFFLKNKTLRYKIKLFTRFDFDSNELYLYDIYTLKNILRKHKIMDYKTICKKRRDNFLFLHKNLKSNIIFDNMDCPYGYPLMTDNNLRYRKLLWENDIHSFILWNTLYDESKIKDFKYIAKLKKSNLILPVNHDLTKEDLETIIKVLDS